MKLINPKLLRAMPLPGHEGGSKEERGRVLVIGGSVEVPGAVLLAGSAALRVGAGKLQIATVKSAGIPMGIALPEALVMGLDETVAGGIVPDVRRLLERTAKCDAVLMGPGMVEDEATDALLVGLLEGLPTQKIILDAAPLSNLAENRQLVQATAGRTVITPHAGEMAQLLGRTRSVVEADPIAAAEEASNLLGAVVVLKGSTSFIVDTGGQTWRYEDGDIGLATSGSGDVLAGLIVGLLARGCSSSQAAVWGVYLHGEAGRRVASKHGKMGFLARELAMEVPTIMEEIRHWSLWSARIHGP